MKMFHFVAAIVALTFAVLSPMSASAFSLSGLFKPHEPNGFRDTGCDPAFQTPIKNEAGEILYWNNPTCPAIDPTYEGKIDSDDEEEGEGSDES